MEVVKVIPPNELFVVIFQYSYEEGNNLIRSTSICLFIGKTYSFKQHVFNFVQGVTIMLNLPKPSTFLYVNNVIVATKYEDNFKKN